MCALKLYNKNLNIKRIKSQHIFNYIPIFMQDLIITFIIYLICTLNAYINTTLSNLYK